jgi:hypothetical protein
MAVAGRYWAVASRKTSTQVDFEPSQIGLGSSQVDFDPLQVEKRSLQVGFKPLQVA